MMVAYNFHPMFEDDVADGRKTHTVRADRKRHARPGEAVQLFCGMRTRHCRKILTPDPICTSVRPIVIGVILGKAIISRIDIDGARLSDDEIEAFAISDGFAPQLFKTARQVMGGFWLKAHGTGQFVGVIIGWQPSDG